MKQRVIADVLGQFLLIPGQVGGIAKSRLRVVLVGHCEAEDNCSCSGAGFLNTRLAGSIDTQLHLGHCAVQDNCCCSRAVFCSTRLTGAIVKSRILAAVVGQGFIPS